MITKEKILQILRQEDDEHELSTEEKRRISADKIMELIANQQFIKQHTQLCPKCHGEGDLLRYNSPAIMGTNSRPVCDVCNGNKVIINTNH